MHFHLPKPLHGWREFAGEVGIIVLGVLIALSAEQVVETIHWRNELAKERASLLQEASDSLHVVALRMAQQPCIESRLRTVRLVLQRHHDGQPFGLSGDIGVPTGASATRGTWQIALAGQALAHMTHKEKLAYSDAFGEFDLFDDRLRKEVDVWLRLAPLNTPDLLTEENWSGIRSAYAEAVFRAQLMRVLAPSIMKSVTKDLPEIGKFQQAYDLSAFQRLEDQICKPVMKVS
jgi:hypothetical protein